MRMCIRVCQNAGAKMRKKSELCKCFYSKYAFFRTFLPFCYVQCMIFYYLCAIMNDKELLKEIRESSSESALRALFDLHYDRLFRVALYFTQNEDLAKEVTLDVFATIWEKRSSMIIPQDFRHFSFTMVKNASINLLKKENGAVNESEDDATDMLSPDAQQLLEESELFEQYERLLSELPERCREVFMLVKEDGKSYAEAAEELQISVKTVDAQMQKALQYLRSNLAKYLERDSGKRFFSIFL